MFLITFCLLIDYSFAQTSPGQNTGWKSVYSHDENGKSISGNIENLFDGLRKGYSLKIGWSWTRQIGDSMVTLEHIAEPIFVTIIQKKNVSAIINAHPLLKSYIDINKQEFDNPENIWQCVLTTQGTFNAMVFKKSTGEKTKDWPQRHQMTWFLEYP